MMKSKEIAEMNRKKVPEWDTGQWRNCFHFRPVLCPEPNVERRMSDAAKKYRNFDVLWGVVHPDSAACAAVFRTKSEAEKHKRSHANLCVVVKVAVTPIYMSCE